MPSFVIFDIRALWRCKRWLFCWLYVGGAYEYVRCQQLWVITVRTSASRPTDQQRQPTDTDATILPALLHGASPSLPSAAAAAATAACPSDAALQSSIQRSRELHSPRRGSARNQAPLGRSSVGSDRSQLFRTSAPAPLPTAGVCQWRRR